MYSNEELARSIIKHYQDSLARIDEIQKQMDTTLFHGLSVAGYDKSEIVELYLEIQVKNLMEKSEKISGGADTIKTILGNLLD